MLATSKMRWAVALAPLWALACAAEGVTPDEGDEAGPGPAGEPDETVLVANDDYVQVQLAGAATIDVAVNDDGAVGELSVEITSAPVEGVAEVRGDQIYYQAGDTFIGGDTLTYRISTADGQTSEANLYANVLCDECAAGRTVEIRWLPGNPIESLGGFRIYAGPTPDPADLVMVRDVGWDTEGFDMEADILSTVFDAWDDLGLMLSDQICFRATAYNGQGESEYSDNYKCVKADELEPQTVVQMY